MNHLKHSVPLGLYHPVTIYTPHNKPASHPYPPPLPSNVPTSSSPPTCLETHPRLCALVGKPTHSASHAWSTHLLSHAWSTHLLSDVDGAPEQEGQATRQVESQRLKHVQLGGRRGGGGGAGFSMRVSRQGM